MLYMELKCINSNGEIVLAKKLNHIEIFSWKIVKIAFKNESYKLFFLGRCSKCPKNKIVHNFLITNPNEMNQSFTNRKNIIYTRKVQNFHSPSPLFWAYLGIIFVPGHRLKKKLYSHKAYQFL